MALRIKMVQKLTQQMALTPQMRQSIHILQLPLLELKDYLEQQIEENPTLEEERNSELGNSIIDEQINKLIEREEKTAYSADFFNAGYNQEEIEKKQNYQQNLITKEPSLQEYLIRQLRILSLSEKNCKIGELIIAYIDENGYLQGATEEIASLFASTNKIQITSQDVDNILCIIQTFEPLGIGARNLKECLTIQLRAKGKQNSLAYHIVQYHLADLAKNETKFIARSLKVSLNELKEALKEISHLEPKPGRAFTQAETRRILPRSPDIIVEKIDDRYEIIINNQELPRLKINSHYKNLLCRNDISEETKKYLREKVSSALGLIKAVAHRQQTIYRVAESIIQIQKDFFEHGQEESLKPLTLQEIAQFLGRNESTISRVVNNKYIQTPYGIFKLNYFFSNSFRTDQGETISAEAVKAQIIDLINKEDNNHPLSDDNIAKQLSAQGINIARRTIAKYREELKIPPSYLRKE